MDSEKNQNNFLNQLYTKICLTVDSFIHEVHSTDIMSFFIT